MSYRYEHLPQAFIASSRALDELRDRRRVSQGSGIDVRPVEKMRRSPRRTTGLLSMMYGLADMRPERWKPSGKQGARNSHARMAALNARPRPELRARWPEPIGSQPAHRVVRLIPSRRAVSASLPCVTSRVSRWPGARDRPKRGLAPPSARNTTSPSSSEPCFQVGPGRRTQ